LRDRPVISAYARASSVISRYVLFAGFTLAGKPQSDRILQSQLRQSAADSERLIAVAFLPICAQINWLRPSWLAAAARAGGLYGPRGLRVLVGGWGGWGGRRRPRRV